MSSRSRSDVSSVRSSATPSASARSRPSTVMPQTPSSQMRMGRQDLGARRPVGVLERSSGSLQSSNSSLGRRPKPSTPSSARSQRRQSQAADGEAQAQSSGLSDRKEIWGTNINVSDVEKSFDYFFTTFVDPANRSRGPIYPTILEECLATNVYFFNLNCANLHAHDPTLYEQLVTYPVEVIPIFDRVIDRHRQALESADYVREQDAEFQYIQVRPFNLKQRKNMRELNPEDIETLVAVKGMVIRVGNILPTMKVAHFVCSHCGHHHDVQIIENRIEEPKQCGNCSARYTYAVEHNRCLFADRQYIKVQETPDSIPDGETPHSVTVVAYGELVDVAKPGDRVEITGIYKADPIRPNPRRSQLNTVYSTSLDAIHFKKTDAHRLAGEDDDFAKSDAELHKSQTEGDEVAAVLAERDERMRELGRDPNIYERLVRSMAPSIWEMDDVKKGILSMLFGGATSEEGAASGRFRGEINVLMCGDPGTSKSQLLQYVHKIAPRGIYTSGKGSSAVGLTASITKDPDSREMVLESGALVLSDRGICCIDEFDKMSDATRSILHEVMEQQTVSIAKAGIVCTLNARTSILASANPKESRYNPNLSVVENIQIMPTLLSRFDLIYLILDQPNESKDRKLARHLVSLYYDRPEKRGPLTGDAIRMEELTQYISYARRAVKPLLTPEAEELLIEGYTKLRNVGNQSANKVVTATPRQLEALIRLSEAQARIRLSNLVERRDVMEARRLMDVATQSAATDPTTGRIDMDLLTTGHSTSERKRDEQAIEALRSMIAQMPGKAANVGKLLVDFNNQSDSHMTSDHFKELLQKLEGEGLIAIGANQQIKKLTI